MNGSKLIFAVLVAALIGIAAPAAHADTMNYTFTGTGGGTINGNSWGGNFSLVLTGDTANISSGSLHNLGGTFTEGGYSAALSPLVTLTSGLASVSFLNAAGTDGLGLFDLSLLGYNLATPTGPDSNSDFLSFLMPTFNGGSFGAANGDAISFTSDRSLTFSAARVATPEPSTLPLLSAGLAALTLLTWKRRRLAAQAKA